MRIAKYTFPLLLALLLGACAHLNPGADPFVVRVEQAQTGVKSTFDFVLNVDHADRGFWMTNAPAFHNFCEWLRTPTVYIGPPLSTNARCVVMQLNVDDLKLAYKAAKTEGNSNALYSAVQVLGMAASQANSWSNIVVTPTHP